MFNNGKFSTSFALTEDKAEAKKEHLEQVGYENIVIIRKETILGLGYMVIAWGFSLDKNTKN